MSVSPLVSAIVLNYRSAQDTVRCIEVLLKQTIKDDLEIIVVDNHSRDDSMKILRGLLGQGKPITLLRTPKNVGYGQGNAIGIESAKGEFILIINPDTAPEPDALETMMTFLRKNPDVGIIGPQLIFPNGKIRDSYRTFPTIPDIIIKRTFLRFFLKDRMRRYLQWDQDPNAIRDVHWLAGACLLMRRDFFDELGGYDPRFFLFLEDTDLCRRCWEAGKRVVYCPKAKAHDSEHRLSSGGIFSFFWKKTVRIHVMSAIKYFWKWRGKSFSENNTPP